MLAHKSELGMMSKSRFVIFIAVMNVILCVKIFAEASVMSGTYLTAELRFHDLLLGHAACLLTRRDGFGAAAEPSLKNRYIRTRSSGCICHDIL